MTQLPRPKKRAPKSPSPVSSLEDIDERGNSDSSDLPQAILTASQRSASSKRSAPDTPPNEQNSDIEFLDHQPAPNSTSQRTSTKRSRVESPQKRASTNVAQSAPSEQLETPSKRSRKLSLKAAYMAEEEPELEVVDKPKRASSAKNRRDLHVPQPAEECKERTPVPFDGNDSNEILDEVLQSPPQSRRAEKPSSKGAMRQGGASDSWEEWESDVVSESTPKAKAPRTKTDVKAGKKRAAIAQTNTARAGSDDFVESSIRPSDVEEHSSSKKPLARASGKKRVVEPPRVMPKNLTKPRSPVRSRDSPSPSTPRNTSSKVSNLLEKIDLALAASNPDSNAIDDGDEIDDNTPTPPPAVKKVSFKKAGGKAKTVSVKPSKASLPKAQAEDEKSSPLEDLVPDDDAAPLSIYPKLPRPACVIASYIHRPHVFEIADGGKSSCISADVVLECLSNAESRSFARALTITATAFFVNPSRAGLHSTTLNQNRAVHPATRHNTVFIFNGAVASCSIANPAFVNQTRIRCISLFPLAGEYQQWLSFVASLYSNDSFIGYADNDIITFCSRKEGAGSATGGSTSTTFSTPVQSPQKRSKYFADETASSSKVQIGPSHRPLPSYVNFDDGISIYDARKSSFDFTSNGMADLVKLPLYHQGLKDLPEYSIVSVGYTLSAFTYSGSGQEKGSQLALSLNLQFVVLHGILPD